MPKEEKQAKSQKMTDYYPKLYKDVSDEIVHLTGEIKYEIQWLEQHCQKIIGACESEGDLRALVELRNNLEKTRNELRRESYSLSDSLGCVRYLLGEMSSEELEY
jgi:hypothetical protein